MGCCLSKDEKFKNSPSPPFPQKPHPQVLESDPPRPLKAPLSPVFEEESVKEVLSETPKPKPQPQPKPKASNLLKIDEREEEKKEEEKSIPIPTSAIPKIEQEKKVEVAVEEISEVSEICSLSESISTTTITSKKEDEDGEVQQKVHRSPAKALRKRSIPGDFVGKHERGSKSPARRLNPSPGRRNDTNSELGQTTRRRLSENTNSNNRVRRDSGERSGRRSRSPATRVNPGTNKSGIGRSPSRKAPRSPARTQAAVEPENGGKVEETKEGNSTNESIENPLVSMECFIFL